MLSTAKFATYGLENEKPIDFDNVTIESIVEEIERTCNFTYSEEGVVGSIKDMVVNAIKAVWEFIKKIAGAIKDFFKNLFIRDKKLEDDITKTQEKIKLIESKKPSTESFSLESAAEKISIGAVAAIDIHDKLGDDIGISEFDSLILEFNKTTGTMNNYYQQIDSHLKTVSEIKEEVISTGNADKIISQIRNKPSVPTSIRAKEFDFFTVGKIGLPDHFIEPEAKGLNGLPESFNKNVPRLIKNVSVDPISLSVSNLKDLVSLTDKWHNNLEAIKKTGKLSGQYLKIALSVLEEKEKHFSNLTGKLEDVLKKEGNDENSVKNFHAYISGVKAQINYINMYIHVMVYYHNAFAKIAEAVRKVVDKLVDIYLNNF